MNARLKLSLLLATATPVLTGGAADIDAAARVSANNVIWTSPSKNSLGSMPIGNGDLGANVWVEPSGGSAGASLVLLLSKTDAFDEFNRLLKLGRIRIKTTPPLATGDGFRQELRLQEGCIELRCGTTQIRVWSDANHPVVQVDVQSPTPVPRRS